MRLNGFDTATVAGACLLSVFAMGSARAADVGVATCDKFLATYESCVVSKVPDAKKVAVMETLAKTKANWVAVAATPDGKAKLEATCKDTVAQSKKEFAAANCAW